MRLIENERWVAHTYEVIAELEQLVSLLKDAETGSRGFVITGRSDYLKPYHEAVGKLQHQLQELQQLTADNPAQQERFPELRDRIARRLSLLEDSINLRREKGFAGAQQMMMQGSGRTEMDAIRTIVSAMEAEEYRLLTQRREESRSSSHKTLVAFAVAAVLALIFLIITYRLLQIEQNLRTEAETNAVRLEKVQAISDAALSQLSIDRLIDELLDRIRQVLNTDTATLLLTEADGKTLRAQASKGISEEGVCVPIGEGFAGRVAASRQPLILEDVPGGEVKNPLLKDQVTTLLGVPLRVEEKIVGVLHVGRHSRHAFDVNDQKLLQMVGDRIAVAVDRARAYEAESCARAELSELNKQLEDRVRRRTAELEAANRELEAFSYSVSHDLRAPLRTMDGFSQAVLEDYAGVVDDTGKDYLNRIRAASQRMGQLIDALLQLSRVSRAELELEQVNLTALARSVVEELRSSDPGRDVHVSIEESLEATGDARLLQLALQNLLGNAWKFTARRERAVIHFGKMNGQPAPVYFVRDNGAGFDMRYAGKLFSAFQRLHGDAEFRGSGIGLATVQRIIRRHHGRIWAESMEGQGATFYFELGV